MAPRKTRTRVIGMGIPLDDRGEFLLKAVRKLSNDKDTTPSELIQDAFWNYIDTLDDDSLDGIDKYELTGKDLDPNG